MSGKGPKGGAKARALAGLAETPNASNKAIARRVGVSFQTVMRARGAPQKPTRGYTKQMSDERILKFCEKNPAAADSVTRALRTVVDFNKGRGAMLRSIQPKRNS